MKHYIAKIGSILIAATIILASITTAFAEDALKINNSDKTANKGDTIKFTLNLSDTKEPVIGFELRVFFDPEKLELVKGSVTSETFDNLFFNEDLKGKLPLNWTDFNNPVNCEKKTPMFSCDFKVLDGGDAEISYFVTELYGDDMTYLKSYSWTYDLTDGNNSVVSDGVLPISKDEETLNNRQSQFINYVDGKGEENSPNKDNHESVVGKPHTTQIVNEVVENTRYEDVNGNGGNGNGSEKGGISPLVIVLIAVPVVIVLIVVAVVLSKKKSKAQQSSDYEVDEPKFDLSAEQQAMEEAGEVDDDNP
jgi:hypothetical protein